MSVIDEWGRFDQSIVDAATAASGAVVSELCPRSGAHFEHQT